MIRKEREKKIDGKTNVHKRSLYVNRNQCDQTMRLHSLFVVCTKRIGIGYFIQMRSNVAPYVSLHSYHNLCELLSNKILCINFSTGRNRYHHSKFTYVPTADCRLSSAKLMTTSHSPKKEEECHVYKITLTTKTNSTTFPHSICTHAGTYDFITFMNVNSRHLIDN